MSRSLDYFFTLASPWAYLGHDLLGGIAARHHVTIRYRPMPIRSVFDRTGSLPLPQRPPARQRYRLVELQRWRDRRGLPLVLRPAHVPFDADVANRVVVAMVQAGADPHAFVAQAFKAAFADEKDLADEGVIAGLMRGTGHDVGLLTASKSEATARLYAGNGDSAVEADVFGAPGYVLDGEVFWGQDRLELLEEALASGRGAYTPS